MYTFILSFALVFIVMLIICGKSIVNKIFEFLLYGFVLSLISTIVITGVLSKDLSTETITVKDKKLSVISFDTINKINIYLKEEKDGDIVFLTNSWDHNRGLEKFYITKIDTSEQPRFVVTKIIKNTEQLNNWSSTFAVPSWKKTKYLYLPNDSIHEKLINKTEWLPITEL